MFLTKKLTFPPTPAALAAVVLNETFPAFPFPRDCYKAIAAVFEAV